MMTNPTGRLTQGHARPLLAVEDQAALLHLRQCILERGPVVVSLSSKSAERENPQLYLLRNAPVSRIEQYLL